MFLWTSAMFLYMKPCNYMDFGLWTICATCDVTKYPLYFVNSLQARAICLQVMTFFILITHFFFVSIRKHFANFYRGKLSYPEQLWRKIKSDLVPSSKQSNGNLRLSAYTLTMSATWIILTMRVNLQNKFQM